MRKVLCNTEEAAELLGRSLDMLRKWSCLNNGPLVDGAPLQPLRLKKNGPLAWRVSDLEKILGERIDFSDVAPATVTVQAAEAQG